ALPFGLKLLDGLLVRQPANRDLLLAAARGYALYTHAFVALPAERVQRDDIGEARALRRRARNLALRAEGYARRALELDYPGIGAALAADPAQALLVVNGDPEHDVPALYWTAVGLGLAIS